LPVVVHYCKILLSNTEKPRLKVFDKRVLKDISGSTGEEVRRDWRKLHCEELHE
jgi:hypothetical protein